MLADVRTAVLYGDARRSLYIELPPEDPLAASGRQVGKLERAMYGTRDTPMIRQLLDTKFKGCFNMRHETFSFVHVDGLLCTRQLEDLSWLMKQLLKEFELETMRMGEDDDMEKKAILSR